MWLVATTTFSYFISGWLEVYTAILPLGGTTARASNWRSLQNMYNFHEPSFSIHCEVWLGAFCLDPVALAYATCLLHLATLKSRRIGPKWLDWIMFTVLSFFSGKSRSHFHIVGCPVKSCNWTHWHLVTIFNRCSIPVQLIKSHTKVWDFSLLGAFLPLS